MSSQAVSVAVAAGVAGTVGGNGAVHAVKIKSMPAARINGRCVGIVFFGEPYSACIGISGVDRNHGEIGTPISDSKPERCLPISQKHRRGGVRHDEVTTFIERPGKLTRFRRFGVPNRPQYPCMNS